MNEYDVLYDKIAYFIEIKIVQILSTAESFGHFDFWNFCKGKTSVMKQYNVYDIDFSKIKTSRKSCNIKCCD